MHISEHIADVINKRLIFLRISKKEFAEKAGVQPSIVTKWLSGKHNFTVATLEGIELTLGIDFFKNESNSIRCAPCITEAITPK